VFSVECYIQNSRTLNIFQIWYCSLVDKIPSSTRTKISKMAAESGCVIHRQEKLSTSSVDKDEWNDFNGFEATKLVQSSIQDCVNDGCGLAENCANCVSADGVESVPLPSAAEANCLLHDAIERCFCRSSPEATNKPCARSPSPVITQSQDSLVSDSRYV